ncbi:MAG: DUF4007 family protein [Limnospira sp.]
MSRSIIVEGVKPVFARHETFHPRFGWLKKGFNRASEDEEIFKAEDAPVRLGVGKNMVASIRYWCRAFKLLEDDRPTDFGKRLLSDGGWDPFLEDPASLWLLHWRLLQPPCSAAAWYFAFNQFPAAEFYREDLLEALRKYRDMFGRKITAIGVPSFVAEWLLEKIVPGSGTLTPAEQEKVNQFIKIELAPKGTEKSFVFENISSKVTVIGGGKVTAAQLFVNGRTKEVGLLGRNDVLVLDEVQSLTFDNPDEIIGTLKTYLANGRYNRSGFADISSDCSLVMLANIELDADSRPRNEDNLIANLPKFFSETAFLDRFSAIIPGWEIPKFRRDLIASQVGLKMDFFGEVLLSMRYNNEFLTYAQNHTQFGKGVTIRDQNAILKSASGFLKLLYPHLDLTPMDFRRDCLQPARELRQYIRNSLYYLDEEFRQYDRTIEADIK